DQHLGDELGPHHSEARDRCTERASDAEKIMAGEGLRRPPAMNSDAIDPRSCPSHAASRTLLAFVFFFLYSSLLGCHESVTIRFFPVIIQSPQVAITARSKGANEFRD